jgi:hypothetical protein
MDYARTLDLYSVSEEELLHLRYAEQNTLPMISLALVGVNLGSPTILLRSASTVSL